MSTCALGHANPNDAAFCGECGSALPPGPGAAPPAPPTQRPLSDYPPPAPAAPLPPTYQPAPTGGYAQPPAHVAPTGASFAFDLRRLTVIDQITAGSSIVVLLALFMPWFGIAGYNVSGLKVHSWLVLVFLIAALLIAYLVLRAGFDRLPVQLPVAHAPLLLVLGAAQLFLVFLGFVLGPDGLSRGFGAYLAMMGALGAVLPVGIPAIKSLQSPQA